MKKILLATMLLSTSVFAQISDGNYVLEKIVCSNGKQLKLGGKFMSYDVTLNVSGDTMTMTAVAKSAEWAPFKLDCTQINTGKFTYISANSYDGYLSLDSATCNAAPWELILRKKGFGVEKQGVSNYVVSGNQLMITNVSTENVYSCPAGSLPVYYYNKQ